ncbi:SRPBCC domain-containing protein [Winogradskyella echinorum]|uniref:SRPBCC domain-containing protein n=1 Tax=Winogradskyella echinorum TaxID=538189 RepID=A0ABR6XY39_9FLAO|nr:SRPBCC domain-containing protein [Winogradskyella echinorum]MBC3845412.1 SRPBCC domain-containing protein [Winogradskyella echinorum]MBC5749760.1 SRPBCC domain-containing protein [Winogradskyella echinorum]
MLNKTEHQSHSDYKKQIMVQSNAKTVFNALTENIHLWWSQTSESSQKTDGQFTVTFDNGYWWTFKILEFVPNTKLVWQCIAGEPDFNKEWIGHILHWQIKEEDSKTTISFHQTGLTPQIDCYDVCSRTWDMFITEKLKAFVEKK